MALKNTVTDLTSGELAALKAADTLGRTAALAGTAAIHSNETAAIGTLFRALRGRGVAQPINLLLAHYFGVATGSQAFNWEVAKACAATPGTVDDSRAVEES